MRRFVASAHTETPRARTASGVFRACSRCQCTTCGEGGTPLALSHGFYNTVLAFHPGSVHGTPGTERSAARDQVTRASWRAEIRRIHPARESDVHRAGRDVGENLRAGEAGQRLALKGLSKHFARPYGESATGERDGGVTESGAAHFPDGKPGFEQLAFRLFEKFVSKSAPGIS